MDRAAQPVIEHLLLRGAKLIVVSQLPAGLASARRLIAKAEEAVRQPGRPQLEASVVIEAGFLPGGAASLPLLGVAPARALPLDPALVDLKDRFTPRRLGRNRHRPQPGNRCPQRGCQALAGAGPAAQPSGCDCRQQRRGRYSIAPLPAERAARRPWSAAGTAAAHTASARNGPPALRKGRSQDAWSAVTVGASAS